MKAANRSPAKDQITAGLETTDLDYCLLNPISLLFALSITFVQSSSLLTCYNLLVGSPASSLVTRKHNLHIKARVTFL